MQCLEWSIFCSGSGTCFHMENNRDIIVDCRGCSIWSHMKKIDDISTTKSFGIAAHFDKIKVLE